MAWVIQRGAWAAPYRVSVALALSAALSSHAAAQSSGDTAAAQGLFDDAKALMAAGKAREACPKFEESQRLDPGTGTLLNLALCYEKTGRIASAWSRNLEAAAAAKAAGSSARESAARRRAAALAPRVSKLQLDVPTEARLPRLELTRDGEPIGAAQWGVPIPTDAGEHAIVARAPGFKEWHGTVIVKGEGSRASMEVPVLEAEPAAAPVPVPPAPVAAPLAAQPAGPSELARSQVPLGKQRVAALVVASVGVVGLGFGIAFGLKSKSEHDDAAKACSGSDCTTDSGVSAGQSAYHAGNVATVATALGLVGLAGGAALWFTAPHPQTESSAFAIGLTPGMLQARGSF